MTWKEDADPELNSEGTIRKASVEVSPNFTVQEKNNEERKVTFEFSLPAGSYATIVLREFMKTDPSGY